MTFQKRKEKIKFESKPNFRKNSTAIVKSFLLKEKGFKYFRNMFVNKDELKLSRKKEVLAEYYKNNNVNLNGFIESLLPKVGKKKAMILQKDFKNSKLSYFFFRPWIKGKKLSLTTRQKYLNILYKNYRTFSLSERKDFLKTSFGEILTTASLNRLIFKPADTLFPSAATEYDVITDQQAETFMKMFQSLLKSYGSQAKKYKNLINPLQKGWFYENLLKQNYNPNTKRFVWDRPHKAFQSYYKQQAKEPWIDALIFKRWAYFGLMERARKETKNRLLKMKDFLRKRSQKFEKRNKLYWWRRKLLFDFHRNNQIKKHKAGRIKQVLEKIYFPFYGHLNKKQFQTILKKNKKKKSHLFNKNEMVLSSLENRLDVIVYRLNFAPNILWARRLIQEGAIFVSNFLSSHIWTSMYSNYKNLIFPLKLRDPKNLYKAVYWNPNQNLNKYQFLLKPIKKIDFLVKPGDLVQSAKSLAMNKIKSNSRLFKKPLMKNWYKSKKIKYYWNNVTKVPKANFMSSWQKPVQQITTAMLLYNPRFTDLQKSDRGKELFFRWITL